MHYVKPSRYESLLIRPRKVGGLSGGTKVDTTLSGTVLTAVSAFYVAANRAEAVAKAPRPNGK